MTGTPARLAMPGRRAFVTAACAWPFVAARAAATDAASAEREQAGRRSDLCSQANPVGVGLRGEYFEREGCLGGAALTRIDPVVDFDPTLAWPADRARHLPRSVRWSGWVKPPISGRYRFHLDVPGARIEVARQRVAGDGAVPAIELHRGRYVPIVATVDRLAGGDVAGRIALEWTAPYGARYVVPRALLHLPSETVRN